MDAVVQIRAFVAREVAIDSLYLLYSNERAKLRDKLIYALISINYVGLLEFLAVYGDKKIRTAAVQQRINPRKRCTFMGAALLGARCGLGLASKLMFFLRLLDLCQKTRHSLRLHGKNSAPNKKAALL